jgi:hypothetical protein
VSLIDHYAYLFAACFDLYAHHEQVLLCCLLKLPLSAARLSQLYSNVKHCGLSPEEQEEYLQLWLDELEADERAEVQALISAGKTVLEAINSFRGRRNGKLCYLVRSTDWQSTLRCSSVSMLERIERALTQAELALKHSCTT